MNPIYFSHRRKYDFDVQISASGCVKGKTGDNKTATADDDGDDDLIQEFEKVCKSKTTPCAHWQSNNNTHAVLFN